MFRATTESAVDRLLLRLEGRLTGAWVAELDASWRQAIAMRGDRAVIVDLCDLGAIDDAGRSLLIRMHRSGARFVASGCATRELASDIMREAQSAGIEEEKNA